MFQCYRVSGEEGHSCKQKAPGWTRVAYRLQAQLLQGISALPRERYSLQKVPNCRTLNLVCLRLHQWMCSFQREISLLGDTRRKRGALKGSSRIRSFQCSEVVTEDRRKLIWKEMVSFQTPEHPSDRYWLKVERREIILILFYFFLSINLTSLPRKLAQSTH